MEHIEYVAFYPLDGTVDIRQHYNCIYMYVNLINNKKYVGKANNFKNRHNGHMRACRDEKDREYDRPLHQSMRKRGLNNYVVYILEENIEKDIIKREEYFTLKFNTLIKKGHGYNIKLGGTPLPYIDYMDDDEIIELKKKKSDAVKGEKNPFYGRHHKDVSKAKLSKTRIDNGSAKRGKNPAARKIAQYDLDGNLINVYDCIKDAADATNAPSINGCLQGTKKDGQSGGYQWRYVDSCIIEKIEPLKEYKCKHYQQKMVVRYTMDGEFIDIWDSVAEASRALNISKGNIQTVCRQNGKIKQAGGYQWRYTNDGRYEDKIEPYKREYKNTYDKSGGSNPRAKAVNQYSLDGKLINKYDCITDACKENNYSRYKIAKCCNNEIDEAYGYKWTWRTV